MDAWTLVKTRFEHLRNQHLSRDTFERKRQKKWRRFVAYVYKHSPYYARIMAEHQMDPKTCQPEDFPVLTKTDVINHFDDLVTDRALTKQKVANFLDRSTDPYELLDDKYYVMHTSGSSGEIGYFVYSQKELLRGLTQQMRPTQFSLKKKRIAFVGATQGHFAGVTMVSALKRTPVRSLLDVVLIDINSPLNQILEKLNAYQPHTVIGYATAQCILAEKQLSSELHIHPKFCTTSGEPINDHQRDLIESAFGISPTNSYASTEHLVMGFGSKKYEGMYLMEDELVFELQDDHSCVTNLFNHTVPLIRYRMGDVLTPIEDKKHVYPFIKVKEIVGRNEHVPIFINRFGKEDFINPIVIVEFFVKNLRRFQFQIVDDTSFCFKIVPEQGLSVAEKTTMIETVKSNLSALLKEKDLDNVRYTIEEVDDLPVDPKTGKFKLIIPREEIHNGHANV